MLLRNLWLTAALALPMLAQAPPPPVHSGSQPLYRVTIVERSTPAINYTHRSEPTKIDFKGTPLLPEAHGEATVENKRGATMVDAHFSNVPPPTRFGPQYLTYVVWAISPEGRAQSIGELVLNGSDKGHLTASTPMQAFALIVTAEPYYSVSKPSGVVVMENAVRPETVGQVEQVNATYELLPRTEYTYTMDTPAAQQPPSGPAVSMQEYEALLATYQAKNAIQIAIAAGADRHAPDRLKRAQEIFDQARQLPRKTQGEQVVASMREAAQIAEDARAISALRAEEEHDAQAHAQAAQAQIQAQNQAAAARAAEEAAAAQARDEADRAQLQQAPPPPPQPPATQAPAAPPITARVERGADTGRETRAALRQHLSNSGFQTLDTPRGLVVVIPDMLLEGSANGVRDRLTVVASSISSYPGLRIEVDGNADNGSSENANYRVSQQLAAQVRDMLLSEGIPPSSIAAYGYGSTRPVGPNKQENRRVEVVISGAPIGKMPVWDRTYSLERKPLSR